MVCEVNGSRGILHYLVLPQYLRQLLT